MQTAHGCQEALPDGWTLGPPEPPSYPQADPISPSEGVGYLPGFSSVTPAGQYTFQIPIDVPPGRAGMQPALALSYGSGGGNGLLGVGWSLSGLSEIRRCRKTVATEGVADGVDFDDTDAFCLDGQKLVQINPEAAKNGHEGAEYRTEHDSISRIVAHGSGSGGDGPDSFTVLAKSGQIFDYETRVEPHRFRGGFPQENLKNLGKVRAAWLLTEARDRAGNAILYDHDIQEAPSTHGIEHRIKAIRYTSRDDGSGNVTSGLRRVDFLYTDRGENDHLFHYESGVRWETNHRLVKIVLSGPNPKDMEELGEYRLSYEESPDTGRSLLASVERCDAQGGCLRSKDFHWARRSLPGAPGAPAVPGAPAGPAVHFQTVNVTALDDAAVEPPDSLLVADFTGDGLDDVLVRITHDSELGGAAIYLIRAALEADGKVTFAKPVRVNAKGSAFGTVDLKRSRAADVDGDGTMEIVGSLDPLLDKENEIFPHAGFQVFRWVPDNADGVSNAKAHFEPMGAFLTANPKLDVIQLADADGDGLIDLFAEQPDNGLAGGASDWGEWQLARNNGKGGFGTFEPLGVLALQGQFARALDVDGDGRGDLLPIDPQTTQDGVEDTGVIPGATIALGLDDSGKPASNSVWRLRSFARLELADLNADGLRDALYPAGPDTQVRWNLGNGFGPLTSLPSSIRLASSAATIPDLGLRAGAFDGDAKEGFISFDNGDLPGQEQLRLFRLRGGALEQVDLGLPGVAPWQNAVSGDKSGDGWPGSTTGDFNGDGLPDILETRVDSVSGSVAFQIQALIQEPAETDLVVRVYDGGTPDPAETVTYSRVRAASGVVLGAGDPGGGGPGGAGQGESCTWPSQCVRRGLLVVSEVLTAAAGDLHGARIRQYSYEDPRLDLQGRGFLGFGKVTVWDPQLRAQTVTTYDNATRVKTPAGGSLYPFAGLPVSIAHIAPIFDLPPDGAQWPELPENPLLGRITWAQTAYKVEWHDGQSGVYVVHPTASTTIESEREVKVGDGGVAITGPPDPESRRVDTKPIYDDYDNLTTLTRITEDGTFRSTSIAYEKRLDDWLVGLPVHVETLVTDAKNLAAEPRITTYHFDARGLLDTVTVEPDHPELTRITTLIRNGDGLPIEVDVTAGGTTRKTFASYDNLEGMFPIDTWNDLGHHEQAIYQPGLGVPLVETDPNGVNVSYMYDGLGRLRSIVPDGGESLSISYDSTDCKIWAAGKGMCTSITYQGGGQHVAYSDEWGRTWEVGDTGFDGRLVFQRRSYSVFGQPVKTTRPFLDTPGPTATSTFDSLGRPRQLTGPDTAKTTLVHTLATTERTDANSHTTRVERDKDGRVVRTYDVSKSPTEYEYGPFDQIVAITDPYGNATHLDHDKLGRRVRLDDPDQGITTFEHDAFGELRFVRHQSGPDPALFDLVTEYQQDEIGRTRFRIDSPDDNPADNLPPIPETTVYQYDTAPHGLGKLAHTLSPDGIETFHTYDEHGRPEKTTWKVDGQKYAVEQEYDSVGRPSVIHYPAASGKAFAAVNGYNSAGWFSSVSRPEGAPGLALWQVASRNLDGLPTSIAWNAAKTSEHRVYSKLTGRLFHASVTGAESLLDLTYQYDLEGNVLRREDAAAKRTEDFLYDSGDRLVKWKLESPSGAGTPKIQETDYAYDDLGNLESVTIDGMLAETHELVPTRPHQLASIDFIGGSGLLSYGHDARGRVLSDDAGRQIDYTPFDLPRHIAQPPAAGKPAITADFEYDAFGARVKKVSHEGGGATTTTVSIAGIYEVRKRADANGINLQEVYYLHGDDGPIAQVVYDAATHEETTAFFAKDGLGSISAVFDTNGKLLERLFHEPFGRRTGTGGKVLQDFVSSADVALGFTGQRQDDDLDLIDYHGRVYDPVQKRFLTPDPLIPNPLHSQSFNRYAYVGNNPLRFIDPSGFDGEPTTAEDGPHMSPLITLPDVLIIGDLRKDGTPPTPVQSADGHGSQPSNGATAAPSPPSPPFASAGPDNGTGASVAGPGGDLPTEDDDEEDTSWKDLPIVQGLGGFVSGVALGLVPFAGAGESVAHGAGLTAPGTRDANIGKSIGEIVGGAITTYLGIGGAGGGVAASLTGVGAAVGIPEIAVSLGLVVGGVTNVAAGFGNLQTALSTGSGAKNSTSSAPAANAGRQTSKIDRSAFKAEREAYWKAEAKNNPGKYSSEDLAKMEKGRPPAGPDGRPMELHHVDRTPEGGVKPMSQTEHRLGENYKKNHP